MFKKPIFKKIFLTLLVLINALALILFLKYGVVFIAYFPALLLLLFVFLKALLRWIFKNKNAVFKSNITLALASIFMVLFVAETALRFVKSYTDVSERELIFVYKSTHVKLTNGWYQVWNKDHYLGDGVRFNHFRKINSEGLSDVECPLEKTNNEIRILGVGDSFTEGHGADADSTWLKFLERKMKLDTTNSTNLRFLNAGVCGSDPFFEYVLLKDKLLKYKPDMVIFQFCENDITDVISRGGMDRFALNGSVNYRQKPSLNEFFYASSYICRLINHAFFDQYKEANPNDLHYAFNEFKKLFTLLNNFSEKNNLNTYLCFLPTIYNNSNSNESKLISNALLKLPNLKPIYFKKYLVSNHWLKNNSFANTCCWENDGHYNAKGYKLLSEAIYEVLKTDTIFQK